MKIAIYARVSTDDKEQNPERQKLACQNYAELHNHTVIAYEADYISGNTNPHERTGFSKLLKDRPEGIVIYEISRFSRENPTKVLRRLNELKDKGVKIISINEPAFNMEGEFSELMQYILSWVNNYYIASLSRAVKSGLAQAKKDGKVLGRPHKVVNLYELIRLFSVNNASITSVAKQMGITRSTCYANYCKAKKKGLLTQNGNIIQNGNKNNL